MVFGDRDDFAIECHRERPARPPYMFGRMCVWCGGRRLGEIEDVTILAASEPFFAELPGYVHKLRDEAVDELPDAEAFAFLDGRLFLGRPGRTLEQVSQDSEQFGRFAFLTNWGEPFDGTKAFLLNVGGGRLRVLYRVGDGPVERATVGERGVREAVAGFLAWMREQRRLDAVDPHSEMDG